MCKGSGCALKEWGIVRTSNVKLAQKAIKGQGNLNQH